MNKQAFVERLQDDPEWAREILAHVASDALRRWRRRWREGRHPAWIKPAETVAAGFARALAGIPSNMEYDAVTPYISQMIDDYILSLMAGNPQPTPRRVLRGAKRHGRQLVNPMTTDFRGGDDERWSGLDTADDTLFVKEDEEAEAEALREFAQRHRAKYEGVLSGVAHAITKQALTMLLNGESLGVIRRATGMTGPAMLTAYQKWEYILGLAA